MRKIASRCPGILRIILFPISVLIWFTACRDAAPNGFGKEHIRGRISIAHLKTLARDISTPILYDVTIGGYVAANDLYGEYYKSIVICYI